VLRQKIIQNREHRFLHLAGVRRAADQHHAGREIAGDHRLRSRPMPLPIGLQARQIENCEARRKIRVVLGPRFDHQMADEQGMPGIFADHPHRQAVGGVGAGIEVLYEQLAPLRMF
jgi:hypothetical protein